MQIITFGTLKGGTGKTTTAFNLAGILSESCKVLLIDLDPQANISFNTGVDVTGQGLKTVQHIFEDNSQAKEVIFKQPVQGLPNLDIIPSSILLEATGLNIVNLAGREQILDNFILDNKTALEQYDYILIDTNPSMSIINQNAFFAADKIILITDVSANAIQGVEVFIALWGNNRKRLKKADNVSALIINNFDTRLSLSHELVEFSRSNEEIKGLLLDTIVPYNARIKETETSHQPINILQVKKDRATVREMREIYDKIIKELQNKGVL